MKKTQGPGNVTYFVIQTFPSHLIVMEKRLFQSTEKIFAIKFTKKVQDWKRNNIPVLVLYHTTLCYQRTESKSYQKNVPKSHFTSTKDRE
jgi:hypothetical protein